MPLLNVFSAALLSTGVAASSAIRWEPCPNSLPSGLQCSQFDVPMDHTHPHKKHITLGLTKVSSTSSQNTGALFFNPGGPGVPTSDLLIGQAMGYDVFGDAIVDNFDVIGIDPRGVGLSQPIVCDPAAFNAPWPKFPQSEAAFNDLVAYNRAFWESCLNLTGPFLGHVDTLSVAKDFEAVRKAMNISQMSYLGISYGTVLGSQYAELYPQSIRAMALDGDVDHSKSLSDAFEVEIIAYETSFKRFITWCESDAICVLSGQNITRIWTDLIDAAFANPIPALGCQDSAAGCQPLVWGGDILFNAQDLLMFKEPNTWAKGVTWATLAIAIQEAAAGNATILASQTALSNSSNVFAQPAVSCLDWTSPIETFSDLQHIYEVASYLAPLTRGAGQNYWAMVSCIGYPLPVSNPPTVMNITNTGGNPILLTQSLYDPEASILWAESLTEQIELVQLVTRHGDGHTSFSLGGATTEIIDNYLVNLTLPGQYVVVQT